jgi:chromosome segregation ATPase
VLYLAEVLQKKSGPFGGNKTDLKLLACQRGESWSAITGEEIVPLSPDEASKYGDGALVLAELGGNRQVQRISPGRELVGTLQNFSRLQEKYKTKEEEIEQWKESLTYQAHELNRREMEIQARQEELAQMEQEVERFEEQRQEINTSREENERLKEEIDRNRQELEGAWAHLKGEQERIKELESQYKPQAVLDDQQAKQIQENLERLSQTIASPEPIREQLGLALEALNQEQAILDQHWQQLEQQRAAATALQERVERQASTFQGRWQELSQAEESLDQAREALKIQQNSLNLKQEYAQTLGAQLRNQDELYQQVQRLAAMSSEVKISQVIDTEALERMAAGELQAVVQNLKSELDKAKRFVSDQEEELELERQAIAELQQKLPQANDQERQNLQTELADEQDRYQMLEETLVGQRRTLREREEIFSQHLKVLRRRQGIADSEVIDGQKIDLGPVLSQIESARQQQAEELQKLEREIEQMRSSIGQAQAMVNSQVQQQENQRQELESSEQNLQVQKVSLAESWGKVRLYEEILQQIQDKINDVRQKLEAISGLLNNIQESGDYQFHSIAEMRKIIYSLIPSELQQLAAS